MDGQENKKTVWLRPVYTGGGIKVNCIVKAVINTQMCMKINFADLTLYGHIKTTQQRTVIQQCGDWYTGR